MCVWHDEQMCSSNYLIVLLRCNLSLQFLFSGELLNMHPHHCLHLVRDWAQTLSKETWDLVLVGLALSPGQRDNGVARASRLINVRWRAYMFPRLILYLESITRKARATDSRLHLLLCDLQDITPCYYGPRDDESSSYS